MVVDDGSAEPVRAPGACVVRQPALGVAAALRRACAEARGRYLARMDADDLALPERLAVQVGVLEAEGLDAVGGRVEAEGRRRYEAWVNSLVTVEAARRDVFVECPLPHPTLLVRREALEAAGGYREVAWPEDYDLVLRLWARGARFRNVEQVVLRWRDSPERLSRRDARYAVEAFVRCKAHHLRAALLGGRDVVVWGAGPVGKAFARELRERLVAFVEVDPDKIGRTVYGVPVVPVEQAPRFADAFALGAVAGEEARARIRAMVAEQGREEGVDFVAVA